MKGFDRLLLIGCGNMAGAMLQGWLLASRSPEQFTVVDPAPRDLPAGVRKLETIPRSGDFDAILLGVKPQLLAQVAEPVGVLAGPDTVVISILAGVELAVLADHFPRAKGWVRVMPNLAAAICRSPMAVAMRGLDEPTSRAVFSLLGPLGTPQLVSELQFDVVTALAGSGPAFVYRFIDALALAAADLGLPHETAESLALATVDGAAALAAISEDDPRELARRVASPGGTTQAGLDALDEGDSLRLLLEKTLRAARDRSTEMAAEARRNG